MPDPIEKFIREWMDGNSPSGRPNVFGSINKSRERRELCEWQKGLTDSEESCNNGITLLGKKEGETKTG